jgi:carboxylesterase
VAVLPGAEPYRNDGGPTGVLLCHGFTGTPQSLRGWAEALAAAGHTVRLPLLPGHGTTWQQMNRTGWPDWYAEVDRALDDLVDRCAHVVVGGLSMGGTLALRLAERRPADVRALVLVNPSVLTTDRRLKALPLLARLTPSLPGIGSDIARPGRVELAYGRTPTRALLSLMSAWDEVRRDLSQVTQPMLVLRSPNDHVVPPQSAAAVVAEVSSKDVTEVLLERSYHVATLDHDAELIERESLAFVQRVAEG